MTTRTDPWERLASDPHLVLAASEPEGSAVIRRAHRNARCRYCRGEWTPGTVYGDGFVWTVSGTRVRGECRPCQHDSWY